MIRAIKLFAACLLMTGLGTSNAFAEQLSCDDLADVGDAAELVRNALIEIETISEGDEVDSALGELINDLKVIASYEGNAVLEEQIAIMDDGWEQMDGDTLMSGLEGAIDSVDTLISNDCQ